MDYTQQNTKVGDLKKSPAEISKLALDFLNVCGGNASIMTRVYRTAMVLMGESFETLSPVAAPEVQGKPDSKKPGKTQSTALTPDEARLAKEEFRLKLGLSKLTPDQAKMAKAVFREKKAKGDPQVPPSVSLSSTSQTSVPVPSSKKKTKIGPKPDPSLRIVPDGTIPQLGEGSRATWNVKLKQQRQRALERSLELADHPSDLFLQADYFNARLTLEDTWIRFQNTYDCSGKKDPLQELLPSPNPDGIVRGMKEKGVQIRQHGTGHFVLQDETTGESLRPKT
jgi:hypothetical protein